MIIKKFQANTETEAIMLAKEELGKDAIVMNIKMIKPKGLHRLVKKTTVEITAAIDDNISYPNEKLVAKVNEIKQQTNNAFIKEPNNKPNKDIIMEEKRVETSDTTVIEQRLNSLQNLLEQQMSDKKVEENKEVKKDEKSVRDIPCVRLIYNQLLNNEVDETYANQVITEVENVIKKDSSVDNVLASVYQKIILKLGQPKDLQLKTGSTQFLFFIGPTGVGKTTTIAKIASSLILNKKAKLALVTSDTYRIAAVDQLRTYANILGVPIKVVYSEDEMIEAKEEFADFDVVLVDTAGRSHRNREQRDDIETLISTVPEDERDIFLVLSATTKYKDLTRICETYKEITDYSLIFTKLDETSAIGNIFNIKMLTGAPLSYTTCGQNVPDDIGKIDPQTIAKQLLGGNE